MTRLLHDQFAKQFLEELLSPFGEVKTSQNIAAEVRQVDVLFVPKTPNAIALRSLGLLGKMAATSAIFEPFRNPVTADEVCSCVLKLLILQADRDREAKRDDRELADDRCQLWILTPTASPDLLARFGAKLKKDKGVYYLAEGFKSAIVVIHKLPRTPQTLWLRMLGRGNVQQGAIAEFNALPNGTPFKDDILQVLSNFFALLEVRRDLTSEDQELAMQLSPLYLERLQTATEQGIERGIRTEIFASISIVLELKFGTEGLALMPEIEAITDLETLRSIREGLRTASTLEEVRQLYCSE